MSLVDVIIPAYNPGRYLRDSIESVLSQTYKDFSIIVIDDCSTQSIKPIVDSYDNTVYYRTDRNLGPAGARNLAIKNSSAEFISLLDADDLMHKDKLRLSIEELRKDSGVGMTCGNYRVVRNRKDLMRPFYSRPIDINYSMLMRQNFVASGSTTIRRDVFEKVGLFDELYRISEDYDMWVRIAESFRIKYIHNVLYYYSVIPSEGSLTNMADSKATGERNSKLIRAASRKRMENG